MEEAVLLLNESTVDYATSRTAHLNSLFGWVDYFVFVMMLLLSAAIGVFYGFFDKKKNDNTKEFLMAGKSMTAFPIAMSLIAR